MLWSLSSRLFSVAHIVLPTGKCRVVCVIFVGCCTSSHSRVGWVSRSRLIGDVENARFGDLHPPIVNVFCGGTFLLILFLG